MRKIVLFAAMLMILVLVTGVMCTAAPKDTPVKVMIDGSAKTLKPAAFMRGQKVYLPLKAVASDLKATVTYNKAKKTYAVTSGKTKTTIKESEGVKVNGAFMVPFGLAGKALGCNAKWDKAIKTVSLDAPAVGGTTKPAGGG